jgi:hypothetical protein
MGHVQSIEELVTYTTISVETTCGTYTWADKRNILLKEKRHYGVHYIQDKC